MIFRSTVPLQVEIIQIVPGWKESSLWLWRSLTFKKREESLTIAFLGLLRFWCRDKNKISIEPFFKSVKFSIDTLMEELKPVVTERYEFEYQEESISKALIGSFGLSRFCCQDQIKRLLNWIHPYKCNVFVSDLYGKNQTCRKRERTARKLRLTPFEKALFGIFGLSGFWYKNNRKLLFNINHL